MRFFCIALMRALRRKVMKINCIVSVLLHIYIYIYILSMFLSLGFGVGLRFQRLTQLQEAVQRSERLWLCSGGSGTTLVSANERSCTKAVIIKGPEREQRAVKLSTWRRFRTAAGQRNATLSSSVCSVLFQRVRETHPAELKLNPGCN